MSQPQPPVPPQPQVAARPDHRLTWIACLTMALMCLAVLVWTATLPAS